MHPRQTILDQIESIRNLLVAVATGQSTSGTADAEYSEARANLLQNPLTKNSLPAMVRVCRNLGDFWGFIKPKFPTYAGRRNYIREEFDPLLTLLETSTAYPADNDISLSFKKAAAESVIIAWARALERRTADPEAAITAARTLLEATCKHVLDELKVEFDDSADLPKLYKLAASSLKLAPDQYAELIFKQILGGCQTVVEGLGAMPIA
ncbi:MAG: abortive phage resistance protein [Tepidisphaeraceae bacterium]